MNKKKAVLIVVDSCGVGALPDAKDFGDEGVNTLANLAKASGGISLPNLEKIGLGNIIDIEGVAKVDNAEGYYGKAMETSKAKDTTTGHKLAGKDSTFCWTEIVLINGKNSFKAQQKIGHKCYVGAA